MRDQIGYRMTQDDAAEFLESQGYGVLSLANGNDAYGIPISYGYDRDHRRFILELVNTAESRKREFIEAAGTVSLTVLEYRGRETWQSVIATGTLTELSQEEVSDRLAALFFAQAEDVAKELRWSDFQGFEREWYELEATEITGRHGGSLPG